jgi:hypothetical protein
MTAQTKAVRPDREAGRMEDVMAYSTTESVYWGEDGCYLIEANNKWALGDKLPDGTIIIKIEPYDYENDPG